MSAATSPPPRLLPPIDDSSQGYWTGGGDGVLLVTRCSQCRRWTHPPQPCCPACGSPTSAEAVAGDGIVFTYTVSRQQFHPEVPTPFVIALVELPEQPGLRVIANIVDCDPESVHIGMRVCVRFETHGETHVPVFVACEAAPT